MSSNKILGYIVIIPLNDKMPVLKQAIYNAEAFDDIKLVWYLKDYGCLYHYRGLRDDVMGNGYINDAYNNRATAINLTMCKDAKAAGIEFGLFNYSYMLARYITSLDDIARWKKEDTQSINFLIDNGSEYQYYKAGLYTAEEADEIIRKINEMGKNGKNGK